MATTSPSDPDASENREPKENPIHPQPPKKNSKTQNLSPIHPVQYRAIRFVSFMLEEGKHEISPGEFIQEALARHLDLYQIKRGIEFPAKMLAELIKLGLIPSKASLEE